MNKPSVTVVVKKRRGTAAEHRGAQGSRAPLGGPGHEERRPRVYQVHPSTSTAGHGPPAWAPEQREHRAGERDANDRNASTEPDSPAGTLMPARRRRARRDPAHAPGQVTRIVFETPPPPLAPPGETGARAFEFIEHAEVGYEQVMAELQQLSAQLDLALSARRFRIG
ncbi:MAG: hypothetical protein JNN03_20160 [Rubrivivax sp.]|nr:hypothetical protein [Rubrivivax sp.]